MVVTTASVVVLTVGRNVGLDGGMTVQTTNVVRASTEVPGLSDKVTISQDGEDSQHCSKVGAHVETTCGGFQNLAIVNIAVARQVTIVGEKVETRARTTAVVRAGCLESVARFGTLV